MARYTRQRDSAECATHAVKTPHGGKSLLREECSGDLAHSLWTRQAADLSNTRIELRDQRELIHWRVSQLYAKIPGPAVGTRSIIDRKPRSLVRTAPQR